MSFRPLHPVMERQRVMLSYTLNISRLKTIQFCGSQACADRYEFAVGKHVTVRERRPSSAVSRAIGDSVVQEHAARAQQIPRQTEIVGEESFPDMLKHTDTNDFVVLQVMVNVTIV